MNAATRSYALGLALTLVATSAAAEMPEYWPKMPQPKTIYVTDDMDDFPSTGAGDPGGIFGAWTFALQSLAGLAAASVQDGAGDAMIWLDMPKNGSYNLWLSEVLTLTGAKRVDAHDPAQLLQTFIDKGLVKGYILYRTDPSKRGVYESPAVDGYNNSANVATSLARSLQAITVEEKAEPLFKQMGLTMLLDVRDKDEAWLFENHKDKFSRKLVHTIDPRAPHMRDYAIATKSICIYGESPTTDAILHWIEPNAPAYGWIAGDEYKGTSQLSRYGHYTTASNWIFNLSIISSIRADKDVPWDDLRVDAKTTVDPLALDWPKDTHYTSFVMSDGNNFMWFLGDFFSHESYWQAPSRTRFPFAWTAPLCDMAQAGVPALAHLVRTASANDYIMMHDAGYYYFDEYGADLHDNGAALEAKIAMDAERMAKLGVKILSPVVVDWDSPAAVRGYELCAKKIPGLLGIFPIQYAPYNAGLGQILWVDNAEGHPIPVMSARYGLWAQLSQWEGNGPPALLASKLNAGGHRGTPTDESYFDWTIVHAWSWFKPAKGSKDLLAEDMVQTDVDKVPEARRGFEPVAWCVDRLEPRVKVVTPEELTWRARLHLQPKATLDAMAQDVLRHANPPDSLRQELDRFRAELDNADLSKPEAVRTQFERLKRLRFGQQTLPRK